ncbi:hypothetical protein [Pantoea ananatis]|uniref:hypothetical protein n=1 Tax=Pantoea ananas TaxID=553 RepID=UPI00159597B8|nr:hypothetical protein [Pantoea ananatis]
MSGHGDQYAALLPNATQKGQGYPADNASEASLSSGDDSPFRFEIDICRFRHYQRNGLIFTAC